MATSPVGELLGSNDAAVALGAQRVESEIALAHKPLATYAASFTKEAMSPDHPGEPDRLMLRFQNIRGNQSACIFDVSVSIPNSRTADTEVGSLALFGLERASDIGGEHAGSGLNRTFEITECVDPSQPELLKAEKLLVAITPRGKFRPEDSVTIGKISLYRLPAQ